MLTNALYLLPCGDCISICSVFFIMFLFFSDTIINKTNKSNKIFLFLFWVLLFLFL